jgi:preprotein translocase subunit SecD
MLAACGGGDGGQEPASEGSGSADATPGDSFLFLLRADTTVPPKDASVEDAMESARAIIEQRVEDFGGEADVDVLPGNELRVMVRHVFSSDEVAELIGNSGLLEFREPVIDNSGDVVCVDEDGTEFTVDRSQTSTAPTEEGGQTMRCFASEGVVGDVRWRATTGLDREGVQVALTGGHLRAGGASTESDPGQGTVLTLQFTAEGAALFREITERLVSYPLAIFVDGELIGAPTVISPISSGRADIEGLSESEANRLAIQFNQGVLPIPLEVIDVKELP